MTKEYVCKACTSEGVLVELRLSAHPKDKVASEKIFRIFDDVISRLEPSQQVRVVTTESLFEVGCEGPQNTI